MSSSSELSSLKAKSRDKSSAFSQTCSRLSQYIKQKGSIGDLTLRILCSTETIDSSETYQKRSTAMNLFPMKDRLDNTFILNNMAARTQQLKNVTSLSLLPQETASSSFVAEEDLPKLVPTHSSGVNKSASEEQNSAQMTILYGRQVFVFDDFPAEKAKDVMSFASNSFAPSVTQNLQSIISKTVQPAVNSSTPFPSSVNITPSTNNNLIQELSRHPSIETFIYDLPIARKASLRRFLEKRKDRIASRAPYQISSYVSGPSKPAAGEDM